MRISVVLLTIFFATSLLRFIVAAETVVWIGTATGAAGGSKGIYRTTLDTDTGRISQPELAAEIGSPGFLTVRPDGKRLYSLCSLPNGGGGVAAFAIDELATSLKLLNTQSIGDGGGTHVSLDQENRLLFTAQYGAGSTAVFQIEADGKIGPRSDLVTHEGSGPTPRQTKPHPHWTGVSPDNRFLFVPDLGTDQVVTYRIDHELGRLARHGVGRTPPGGGPRHMKFHPNGRTIYCLNELDMSVTLFDYDAANGTMSPTQTISTLPDALKEVSNSASEIRIHPFGQFVYTGNRGHDSITVFRVEPSSGKLEFVEHESIRGSWPRNFNIDSTGRWLIAAGRHSNTLAVFRIDPKSGGLIFSGNSVNCPTPICVEFHPGSESK